MSGFKRLSEPTVSRRNKSACVAEERGEEWVGGAVRKKGKWGMGVRGFGGFDGIELALAEWLEAGGQRRVVEWSTAVAVEGACS